MSANILVTGGTGFIGRAVVSRALHEGARVAVLTRSPKAGNLPDNIQVIGGGLALPDWNAIEKFAPDFCIHCAWVATPGIYLASPENAALADQTLSVAEGLASRGLQKFVGLGTCLEYACSKRPLLENSPRSENSSPYVQAKLQVLDGLKTIIGHQYAWLRIFYAYGPGEHEERFISSAARTLACGEILHLQRPGDTVDYIHVEDIASAILLATLNPVFGILNVGSGQARSVRDVAAMISKFQKHQDAVTCEEQQHAVGRVADVTRLRELGWKTQHDFENTVKSMCKTLACLPADRP